MKIFLISFDTDWCGEDSYALAYATEECESLWDTVDNWAYNEFAECGHDYSDFGYESEEDWENDFEFQYEDYYTVSIDEIDEEEAKEYIDYPIIYDERNEE